MRFDSSSIEYKEGDGRVMVSVHGCGIIAKEEVYLDVVVVDGVSH